MKRAATIGTYGTFTHWYDYDAAGRPWKLYASTSSSKPDTSTTPEVTLAYDGVGRLTSRAYKNGKTDAMSYHVQGWLHAINDVSSTAKAYNALYTWYPNGDLQHWEHRTPNSPDDRKWYRQDFHYDGRRQLTQSFVMGFSGTTYFWIPELNSLDYTYDKNGNLKTVKRYNTEGHVADQLTLYYDTSIVNRLLYVTETASPSSGSVLTKAINAPGNDIPHDAAGRITGLSYAGGGGLSFPEYDSLPR